MGKRRVFDHARVHMRACKDFVADGVVAFINHSKIGKLVQACQEGQGEAAVAVHSKPPSRGRRQCLEHQCHSSTLHPPLHQIGLVVDCK